MHWEELVWCLVRLLRLASVLLEVPADRLQGEDALHPRAVVGIVCRVQAPFAALLKSADQAWQAQSALQLQQ